MASDDTPQDEAKKSSDADAIADAIAQADESSDSGTEPVRFSLSGYDILRELHRGGQGIVYQAIQRATRRKVAIKVMHSSPFEGSAGKARFEREVQILGQLNHPNIVRIHDSGETEDGAFYFVMDYVQGKPLEQFINDARQRPIRQSLELVKLICDAVSAAHLRGVIHRDLKPANIRVTSDGQPIVLDFGLAKVALSEYESSEDARAMTMTGQFVGSLPWASPEQADASPDGIDVRTDVYSLGVIFYQLLTGMFPYEVIGNMRDVLDNILRAEPSPPSTVRRQIDDEVETIILKCLSKEKDRRYQTAGELGRDIEHYLRGEPIEAKRDSGWYVLTKTLRRYRPHVAVAVSFLVLVIAFAIMMTFMWRWADAAEEQASFAEAEAITERNAAVEARNLEAVARADAEAWKAAGLTYADRVINGFPETVEHLVGATAARELWLDSTLAYLRAVEPLWPQDVEARRRLADAYALVGEVRGSPFSARAGTTGKAIELHERALELRRGVLDEAGEARSLLDVARSEMMVAALLRRSQRLDDAIAMYRQAAGHARDASEAEGAALVEEDARRVRHLCLAGAGDTAIEAATRAGGYAEADRLLDQAIDDYERVLRFWEGVSGVDAERERLRVAIKRVRADAERGPSRRRAAADLDDAAEARALMEAGAGYLERATSAYGPILSELEALALEHPADGQLARDMYLALQLRGMALMELAHIRDELGGEGAEELHERALLDSREALAWAQRLADADSTSVEAQRDLALALNKVGNELRDLDRRDEALGVFERSLEIRNRLARSDESYLHQMDLTVGHYKLGEVHEQLAMAASDPERAEHLRRSLASYRRSLEVLEALVDDGVIPESSRHVSLAREAVARVSGEVSDP